MLKNYEEEDEEQQPPKKKENQFDFNEFADDFKIQEIN